MKKIIRSEIFKGLLTVDIEGMLQDTRIGDLITDDSGNVFKLESVALLGFHDSNNQTLVLHRVKGNNPVGNYLITPTHVEDDNLDIEKINEYMKLSLEEIEQLIEEELKKAGISK